MEPAGVALRLRAATAAVFVELLSQAGRPLDARALKGLLERRGVPREVVQAAWRSAQPRVRRHTNVSFDATRNAYLYHDGTSPVPAMTAQEAFEHLLPPRLTGRKARLAAQVRAALADRAHLETRLRETYRDAGAPRAAHERQARIDAARAFAEVAMEVEELAEAGAGPIVLAERVRALARSFELWPIGRAGQSMPFDPTRHAPVGGPIPDGSRVSIIRPGYSWHHDGEDVLLAKAQVAPLD